MRLGSNVAIKQSNLFCRGIDGDHIISWSIFDIMEEYLFLHCMALLCL
jgi:hypothetical protein